MFGGAYRGRRVFVTGHTGFKGSWLVQWLTQLDADVTGYALEPPTDPSLFETLGLTTRIHHVIADVRDPRRLAAEMLAARPHIVFHLAAQPLVGAGYLEPRETFETNVMGTVNLLEAVRACDSVAAAIIVTSDKCYRNLEAGRPFVEDDAMGGRDPYSASKGCAELVTEAYRASFFSAGTPTVASVRAGNVIGGGDWAPDRLVPDCARALAAGEPVVVRHPDAARPWQHVLEPLAGYLWLAARMTRGESPAVDPDGLAGRLQGAWNFGPPSSGVVCVRDVVEEFVRAWGDGEWQAADQRWERPREAGTLLLDAGKADRELDWRGVWSLREAVEATSAWYREFYSDEADGAAMVEVTATQIAGYVAGAKTRAMPWAAGES